MVAVAALAGVYLLWNEPMLGFYDDRYRHWAVPTAAVWLLCGCWWVIHSIGCSIDAGKCGLGN